MLLVPKQLLRSGMTGNVPYYGGRFSPAQAYAVSHPPQPPPRPADAKDSSALDALRHLLDTGVLTQDEYDGLVARVPT